MTLQDLGDLGDLIGGVAVVITLIYLAAQIRQNTALITAQTVQASVDATQRVLLLRAENMPLRAVLRKARRNEDLDADDTEVLASYLQAAFMNFQARLHHHARGLFDRFDERVVRTDSRRLSATAVCAALVALRQAAVRCDIPRSLRPHHRSTRRRRRAAGGRLGNGDRVSRSDAS